LPHFLFHRKTRAVLHLPTLNTNGGWSLSFIDCDGMSSHGLEPSSDSCALSAAWRVYYVATKVRQLAF